MDSTEYLFHETTAALVVEGSIVIEAAPMFRWMVGKQLVEAQRWPEILSCILCTAPLGIDETPLTEQIENASRFSL